jgi:hypothetical protein
LEVEVERQKAENKALTLYINRIIERILQHQGGFETILSTNDDEVGTTAARPAPPNKDKDLPPPPGKDDENGEPLGVLQRVKSIYGARGRSRPQSVMAAAAPPKTVPSLTEDPDTAPRIPLQRNQSQRHSMAMPRRVQTSGEYYPGAAAVVNNMYRGPDHDNMNSVTSPGINSPRTSIFFNRVPSGPRPHTATESERRVSSSAESADGADGARRAALDALNGSDASDTGPSIDTPSPPRSLGSNKDDPRQVLSGNKMRPLRLVTEEQKKNAANRNSWIPNNISTWFGNQAGAGVASTTTTAPTSNPTS